jgi:hypothetical protein
MLLMAESYRVEWTCEIIGSTWTCALGLEPDIFSLCKAAHKNEKWEAEPRAPKKAIQPIENSFFALSQSRGKVVKVFAGVYIESTC